MSRIDVSHFIYEYKGKTSAEIKDTLYDNLNKLYFNFNKFVYFSSSNIHNFEARNINLDIDNLETLFIDFMTRSIFIFLKLDNEISDIQFEVAKDFFSIIGINPKNKDELSKIISIEIMEDQEVYDFLFARHEEKHIDIWKSLKAADSISKLTFDNSFSVSDLHTYLLKVFFGLAYINQDINKKELDLLNKIIAGTSKSLYNIDNINLIKLEEL